MPWKETNPMTEKMKFIVAWQSGRYSHSELCKLIGISRKSGYKWISRFQEFGVEGLEDCSRAHHSHPFATSREITKILLDLKHRYPNWGPKKIKDWLELEHPARQWPAVSTIGEIFKRHGLVKPRKQRKKTPRQTEPFIDCDEPNKVWSADFKGQFKVGSGETCYPLTITDNYSRYLLGCYGLTGPKGLPTKRYFERVFQEYGLPDAIRTDNGTPFASIGVGGLSRLSVWWLKLGIKPERIAPGKPQQNGRHERMHRTLKQEVANPPKKSMSAQQMAFNKFKNEFNNERPHEGIGRKRPKDLYKRSLRPYPSKLPDIGYDFMFKTRKVRSNGQIKWKGHMFFVSEILYGEPIGLKEIEEDVWQLYYATVNLGLLDTRHGKIIKPA